VIGNSKFQIPNRVDLAIRDSGFQMELVFPEFQIRNDVDFRIWNLEFGI
jgi:hypothetical protein